MSVALGHGAVLEESPLGIESKKLVMWLFIVADAATFGALLFGYGYLRVGSPNWIRPFPFIPTILNGMVMTVVLLTSSLTMLAAVGAAQAGRRSAAVRWLGAHGAPRRPCSRRFTSGSGSTCSPKAGARPANPTGGPVLFGGTFFGITGLHLLHVLCGVVAILVVALAFRRGRLDPSHVETTGLYWHFVDLVWMFVFPLVYLMNAR